MNISLHSTDIAVFSVYVLGLLAIALWISRNNTDISYSTRINTVQSNDHYFEVNWNFDIDLATGEYIEMRTSIDDHGDAHAKEGFCNAIRRARVSGEIRDGYFESKNFLLMNY